MGAELILDGGTRLVPDTEASFEHGVLVDFGLARVNGEEVEQNQLAYVAPGEPLELGEAGVASEDPAYAWSWAGRHTGEASSGGDGGPAVYSNS